MLTYGLTTLFVVGSLWYLDLLPIEQFLQSGSGDAEHAANDTTGADSVDDAQAAETALAGIEHWEPEVTTPSDFEPHAPNGSGSQTPWPESASDTTPATPASFANVDPSSNAAAPPFPSTPESVDTTTDTGDASRPNALSEQERIAQIFGTSGANPDTAIGVAENTAGNPAGSAIIPTSAERPARGLPLTNDSFALVDQWITEGAYLKAHRELSQRYWKEGEELEPLLLRLNKTAGMIYFAPQPHFMKAYEVQPGDLLQSIAPQYKLSWEYLARLNRVRPEKIRAGQKLKVIKGPFSAFVDLSDFSLTIHAHGYFVKRYAIGIGKDNSTPIGTFSVKDKLKNPKYYGTDAVIEADDPSNPLGERWIDIGDSYGIHGTIDPGSIGKAESRGCLRLTNEDVIEVYDFLIPGSEVVIRP